MEEQFFVQKKGCSSPSCAWGRLCSLHLWPLGRQNEAMEGICAGEDPGRTESLQAEVGGSTLFLPADGVGLAWGEWAVGAGGPPASTHACPSPRGSFSCTGPALQGSHLSYDRSFSFPLPARGSIPKLSFDEGKLLSGLSPCTGACRKLNMVMRDDECKSKYPCFSTGACMSTDTHPFAVLLWTTLSRQRPSTCLCLPSISPKLV